MTSTSAQAKGASDRVARVVTETLSPAVLVAGISIAVAWHSRSLVWGVVTAVFASAIPLSYILRGVRRGLYDDHHVRTRERRPAVLWFAAVSVVVGLTLMVVFHAPRDLIALVVAMLAGLALTLPVTYWWKVSFHSAVSAGTATTLTLVFGPWLLLSWLVVAAVVRSRVRLRDHTSGPDGGRCRARRRRCWRGLSTGSLIVTGVRQEEPASVRAAGRVRWWMLPASVLLTPLLRAGVVRHAVPVGRPWRRACDHCGTPLAYPWLSTAFAPPGRCPGCAARVAAPGYPVELAAVVVAAVLVVGARPVWQTLAFVWWACWAVVLVFVDVAVRRLPDRLTYSAAAGTVALFGVAAVADDAAGAWVRAVLAGVGVALAFAVLTFALGRRGPGLGDAKLMLSTMAVLGWISWAAVLDGLLLGLTAQGLVAVVLLVSGRRDARLPMGLFLVAGAVAAVALLG